VLRRPLESAQLADLGVDDVVERQQERPRRPVAGEEVGVTSGEQRQGPLPEGAHHIVGGHPQVRGCGVDESKQIPIGVVPERGVGPIKTGGVEQRVPGVLAVRGDDDLLSEIEDDALHAALSPSSPRDASLGFPCPDLS
jgi:hypothetical protein